MTMSHAHCTLRNVLALAREFKSREQKLDILVNMAGVFYPGPFQKVSMLHFGML